MLRGLEVAEKVVVLEIRNRQKQRVQHHPQQRQPPKPRIATEHHLFR